MFEKMKNNYKKNLKKCEKYSAITENDLLMSIFIKN